MRLAVVHGVVWQPAYELHAVLAKDGLPSADVSLQYRARITQGTGEDWMGVALTLSTAETDVAQDVIPELQPTCIRPPVVHVSRAPKKRAMYTTLRPTVAHMAQSMTDAAGGASAAARSEVSTADLESDLSDCEDTTETQTMRETRTVVKESPLAASYTVEGASSVPSDGVAHKVSIATLPFRANIRHVVVPKAKAVAYLQARVQNTSDYRLMPGAVHVFMGDSFVSKTAIKDIAPGDAFDCALGPDTGMRVTYIRLKKTGDTTGGAFSEKVSTTTYTARTVVRNTHPYALESLVVNDMIPVSQDDSAKVRVILNRPEVLAEAADGEEKGVDCEEGGKCLVRWSKVDDASKGGKKQGMYEWVCKVGAGEKVVLVAEWVVKAPVGVKWVEAVV
jgi:uncharacterized protein (TIGR02231 family)